MPPFLTIKVNGVPQVQGALDGIPKAIQDDAMGDVLYAAAQIIADAARSRVRVRTGKLRDSIKIGLTAKDETVERGQGIFVGSTSPIAHIIEFGASHRPARPYMRPAYDAEATAAQKEIRDGFLKALDEEVAKRKVKS
jgi:HK97 gp10 family phage protein